MLSLPIRAFFGDCISPHFFTAKLPVYPFPGKRTGCRGAIVPR
jgi:hypothetical protein